MKSINIWVNQLSHWALIRVVFRVHKILVSNFPKPSNMYSRYLWRSVCNKSFWDFCKTYAWSHCLYKQFQNSGIKCIFHSSVFDACGEMIGWKLCIMCIWNVPIHRICESFSWNRNWHSGITAVLGDCRRTKVSWKVIWWGVLYVNLIMTMSHVKILWR